MSKKPPKPNAVEELHVHVHIDGLEVISKLVKIEQQGGQIMSALDDLKTAVAGIGTDIDEIDGDLQEILDKLAAAGTGGIDAAGVAELTASLTDLKARTRATADKVPEP